MMIMMLLGVIASFLSTISIVQAVQIEDKRDKENQHVSRIQWWKQSANFISHINFYPTMHSHNPPSLKQRGLESTELCLSLITAVWLWFNTKHRQVTGSGRTCKHCRFVFGLNSVRRQNANFHASENTLRSLSICFPLKMYVE